MRPRHLFRLAALDPQRGRDAPEGPSNWFPDWLCTSFPAMASLELGGDNHREQGLDVCQTPAGEAKHVYVG